jgi:putative ABC transport system permease protein
MFAVDQEWVDLTNLQFGSRAEGYDSDEAIREALKTEENVVVVNSSMVLTGDEPGGAMMAQSQDPLRLNMLDDDTFEPHTIIARGEAGEEVELTVIGVMDSEYSMLFGYYLSAPTLPAIAPDAAPMFTTYYYTVDGSRDPGEVAADMERALLQYGAQGIDIAEMMEEFQAQQSGFMTVLQWFMGLGLIVGIAAVGVISYRAVVERRQQIGVLRALGFQASTIGRAFVIETGIIVILGSLAGVLLGLIVSYNLTSDPGMTGDNPVSFIVPWSTIGVTLGLAVGMALLMSWLPARQASRTLPAEALRYE